MQAVDDCKDCIQAEAIRGLREVVHMQKENIDKLSRLNEESQKDRNEIKLNQAEFKGDLKQLKESVGEIGEGLKAYNKNANERFEAIEKEKSDNYKRWKWAIISGFITLLVGVGVSVVLSIMTYFKELTLR